MWSTKRFVTVANEVRPKRSYKMIRTYWASIAWFRWASASVRICRSIDNTYYWQIGNITRRLKVKSVNIHLNYLKWDTANYTMLKSSCIRSASSLLGFWAFCRTETRSISNYYGLHNPIIQSKFFWGALSQLPLQISNTTCVIWLRN